MSDSRQSLTLSAISPVPFADLEEKQALQFFPDLEALSRYPTRPTIIMCSKHDVDSVQAFLEYCNNKIYTKSVHKLPGI